jgi:hypothetical protein
VVAANQIAAAAGKAKIAIAQSSPFHTPMVIASWQPIAKIWSPTAWPSRSATAPTASTSQAHRDDAGRKRWKDLKGAEAYDVSRGVLVSTTDVRRSNSAAMYLALNELGQARRRRHRPGHRRAARAPARGALQAPGLPGELRQRNFDDYVAIGIGKTPMAFIYENQLVSYALAKKGITADMVLMYPQPTIVNKVVFMATNERSRALADLLASHAELQRIAIEYGFRVADTQAFVQAVKPTGLAVEERITQVIDPPSFDLMAGMIEIVTQEMAK